MACACLEKNAETKEGVCEVCRLIDKDESIKQVKFCTFCQVNICCECEKRYDRRFFAMLKQQFDL